MKARLRKIGNSKGIIIPATFLEQLNASEALEMKIENGAIILQPERELRKNWFTDYEQADDVAPLSTLQDTDLEQEDWEW